MPSILESLWKHHRDWPKIRDILINGIDYPCKSGTTEAERIKDVEAMIQRGNHASAVSSENRKALSKIMTKNYLRVG